MMLGRLERLRQQRILGHEIKMEVRIGGLAIVRV